MFGILTVVVLLLYLVRTWGYLGTGDEILVDKFISVVKFRSSLSNEDECVAVLPHNFSPEQNIFIEPSSQYTSFTAVIEI